MFLRYITTSHRFCPSQRTLYDKEKTLFITFSSRFFSHLFHYFFLHLSLVWHLWQQKINIAVGMRALRIRARILSFPIGLSNERLKINNLFAMSAFHILVHWERIMHFSRIFSLFGAVSTHILIGAHRNYAHIFLFFFHGTSHLKIEQLWHLQLFFPTYHYGQYNLSQCGWKYFFSSQSSGRDKRKRHSPLGEQKRAP